MKLDEVAQSPTKYEIFCDLDGVLVDFNETASKIAGIKKSNKTELESSAWAKIINHVKAGNKFYGIMPKMKDADTLWNYIKDKNTRILSSTGKRGGILNALSEKKDWVKSHLGAAAEKRALFVEDTPLKAKYAAHNHILIDDRTKAIAAWTAAGGIGILHKSATQTIKELKKLGI